MKLVRAWRWTLPLVSLLAAAPAAPAPPAVVVGLVARADGVPVPDVAVFAVQRGSAEIRRVVRSGLDGAFRMELAPVVHDFGIMSPRWHLIGFTQPAATQVRMTVAPAFPDVNPMKVVREARRSVVTNVVPIAGKTVAAAADPDAGAPAGDAGVTSAAAPAASAAVGVLTGTVVDETGVGLGGVRILAVDETRQVLVSVAQSDQQGRYRLVTLAGPTRLVVYAPGLAVDRVRRPGPGKVDFILIIDATVDTLTLRTGRVLSFRVGDSIMPEAYPPKVVRATLQQDYGIDFNNCFCPGDLLTAPPPTPAQYKNACLWSAGMRCSRPAQCPLTAWASQCKLPRYWWLRLLQLSPPNPGRREVERPADDGAVYNPDVIGQETQSMWWYDTIKAMQASDARAAAARRPGR
jgi:hypothetical protein